MIKGQTVEVIKGTRKGQIHKIEDVYKSAGNGTMVVLDTDGPVSRRRLKIEAVRAI